MGAAAALVLEARHALLQGVLQQQAGAAGGAGPAAGHYTAGAPRALARLCCARSHPAAPLQRMSAIIDEHAALDIKK
jgi:hypothetical protein